MLQLHLKSPPIRATLEIFVKLNGKWLSCGSHGDFVAVTGSMWILCGLRPALFFARKMPCVAHTGQICVKV